MKNARHPRRFGGGRWAVMLAAACLLGFHLGVPVLGQSAGDSPRNATPQESGLIESVEVSLLVLDVEVLDADGHPIHGLTKDDFEVHVGAKKWPVYSLDDFCRCSEAPQLAQPQGQSDPPPAPVPGTDAAATDLTATPTGEMVDPTHPRFILFFDFSQLQGGVRARSRQAARDWVTHRMRPGDEAMIATSTYGVGVREVAAFTSDPSVLLDAIDEMYASAGPIDAYPESGQLRVQACQDCIRACASRRMQLCERGCCMAGAMEDARRGRAALEMLEQFLAGLESVPGRKVMLLFTQGRTLFPADPYPLDPSGKSEVGDHLREARDVTVSAVASRTTVNVATVSNSDSFSSGAAQNFGSNLAEYTGGSYSRAGRTVSEMLAGAGRECCMYRIALKAPENPSDRIHRVRITVRGRDLPARYRVRFMTPLERWTRRASGYLASPDRADDLPVRTALIPIARGKRRWGLSVHVSVDPEVLTFMPYGEHYRGDWRVAALVTRNDDGASWQMFTTAQLSASGAAARFPAILHTRSLARLKPGDYRLAAVVEDRNNNLLGATETSLVVASGRSGASAIGPILLRERPRVVRLYLPMVGETKALPRGTGPGAGLLPLDPSSIHPGDSLYAATWLCDNENRPTAQAREEQYIRYVAREGVPAFQLPAIAPVPALECVRVDDVIDTTDLEPGNFSYHLRSADSATAHEDANVDLQATFTVKPLPSEPTQTASPD